MRDNKYYRKIPYKLNVELFKNPSNEYRGAPFWAWNCSLNKDRLLRQIGYLKEMGFGGFNMHSRSGMATEYLGDDFMQIVDACCEKAEDENMFAWLYDEDRWPSGSAGGFVTKNKEYRQRILVLSETLPEVVSKEEGIKKGLPYLLTVFDIVLNIKGEMISYRQIEKEEKAQGIKRYAYISTAPESGYYNNQSPADTLSEKAMKKFIEETHEKYRSEVGKYFGNTIPALFTDEPQYRCKGSLSNAFGHEDVLLSWTIDLPESYEKVYGEDIIKTIPELVWDSEGGKVSTARYRYYDHVCQRFTDSFTKQCGEWCEKNNLLFSGHLFAESSLKDQAVSTGECMRQYPYFGIPGVDMLCDWVELNTVKQAQSIVHQYGKEAMMSEMYGVTNWIFDFRGHKFQGDWQAALGVTIRVPHLSWVSMKGSAKRDYPATINYQSPWYKEYSYIENHFARLNTVLTRGKSIVKTAVIHPIESYWLTMGPKSSNEDVQNKLDNDFKNITEWLLTAMIDFDFISESILPEQYICSKQGLCVGNMQYDTVIVANCHTLRRTTLEILKEFKKKGGNLIFAGDCPKYIDAIPSDDVLGIYKSSICVNIDRAQLLQELGNESDIKVINEKGVSVKNLIHTYRQDNDCRWLFFAHCKKDEYIDVPIEEKLTIIVNGEYIPRIYDTVNGDIYTPEYETKNGKTYIYKSIFSCDSLLVQLKNGTGKNILSQKNKKLIQTIDFKNGVNYKLQEDNVYLLDIAEYSLDGGEFNSFEEILRIDKKCREILNFPMADGNDVQPWVLGEENIHHFVNLRFKVISEVDVDNVFIAAEEAESITVNGRSIELIENGYFVDEDIKKYFVGLIPAGESIIEIKAPIGKGTSIENYFLLGDFDVKVCGCNKTIIKKSNKICFGNITHQGMPFYGGNISYKCEFELLKNECVEITTSRYRGAVIKVLLDGVEKGYIAFAPYKLDFGEVSKGKHIIELILYGNRANTFGDLHNCGYSTWYGPNCWYTKGNAWSYEYVFKEFGILSSPIITLFEKDF